MDMASSSSGNSGGSALGRSVTTTIRTARTLPSLFADHHSGSAPSLAAAGKDLDGLIAINDSALSQQIEFILQDAPMEQDEEDDDEVDNGAAVAAATAANANAVNKIENPPTTTTRIITSASDYSNSSHVHADEIAAAAREHLLNGRRIIIQTSEAMASGMVADESDVDEEEDPELNDENLQDIEEEAQAAEAEEEPHHLTSQVKLEQDDMEDVVEPGLEFITARTITTAPLTTQTAPTPQLVLPAGSIVGTTTRTLTVPVSEALAQLQRRPVYISNATVGGMAGATFVRMPAVISRSPMTVLNVVQQAVGPNGAPTTQLILQSAPVNSVSAASGCTPVVVTSSTAAIPQAHTNVATELSIAAAPSASAIATVASSTTTATTIPLSASASSVAVATAATATTITTNNNSNTSATHTAANAVTTTSAATTTTTYQCLECVEKFDSKELFDIHRSGHANNMKCAICNMVLKSLKNYEKHCLRCKPYECQICGRVVRFRPNFIKHMRVHTGQQSERHKYKCDVCHKEFMSFEYFKVHKKIHNENVNLTCEICGKVFSALASLRGHSKLHSGVKLHKCDVCGKGFGQRYNLKIHARTHTGDFPFECKICKKKLHTQSSLQTHMQVHQRDQTSQVTTTIKYEQSTSGAAAATASSGTATTGSNANTIAATIVKMEPQSNLADGPSTSGMQQQYQQHQQQTLDMDENSEMSDGLPSSHIVTTTTTHSRNSHLTTADDSSNESSNASHELAQQQHHHQQQQHQQQQVMLSSTPTRTIVIKNYMQQNDQNVGVIAQQQQTQVIQSGIGSSSTLQQQLLRKTPIIHSTGGATTLSSALASVVQQTGISPSPSPSSSSTSCSSSVVVTKSGVPLSLASAAIGTSTIRSTRNHGSSITSNHHHHNNHRVLQRNNHRNHHRRRHPADLDDDDDDEDDDVVTSLHHHNHHRHHHHHHHHHSSNGRHFDDDDDDEKSSPSLATAAIIKVEPNLYSSGSGDNSNEMLIKEEVMFEDSAAPHSPHSPPSSKYRMSNFDSDLVDHHVDLNHSLPPYGNLFEPHSIPDSIPVQLYPDDDDDFRLDHSSLGGLHNTSSSTTDGDFIKKEWVYGAGSSYTMNGKFDDDSDALCDAANFIYH